MINLNISTNTLKTKVNHWLAHFPLARTATHAFFKCPGMEGWQSGRLRLIRNQMYRKVPGVRIPSPPPG